MAFLTANNGPNAGKRYELNDEEEVYHLGRHPDCQIIVDVGAVSRYHAKITCENHQFYIEDNKSRNGTYLNDEYLQKPAVLKDCDVLRVCDVDFTFHLAEGALPVQSSELDSSTGGSSLGAVLVDDKIREGGSTIMSKLDVSSSRGRVQFTASPEAKLKALLEITRNLGHALSLETVLPGVLDSLFRIFVQADRGFIVLRDERGKLLPLWTKIRREDAGEELRLSRTIVDQVMTSKEAILSADAASDKRFEVSQSIADFRIRSMMCAPLLDSDGNSIGVLQVDTLDQRKRFQQEDLEVLASVAIQAGVAIDHARLHDDALHKQAIERDLEVAHDVQKGFLPRKCPEVPGYRFFDYYEPAHHVGGDYFDYVELPDGRIAVIVADVVGHGIAAALMMAKFAAEAKFSLASELEVDKAVNRLNDTICELDLSRFVTMVIVVIDPASHEATIVNAGHMAPIRRKASGELDEPGSEIGGLPIGITAGRDYQCEKIVLEPGDILALFTDGINECENATEMFSIDRIREHVKSAGSDPAQLGKAIVDDVCDFLGTGEQEDDMCLVCVSRADEVAD